MLPSPAVGVNSSKKLAEMRTLLALLAIALAACSSPVPLPGCVAPTGKAGALQGCFRGHIAVDKATYAPGDLVTIVETATNACSQPAGSPTPCGAQGVYVTTATGSLVWREIARGIACPALAVLVQPGASVSYQVAWQMPPGQTRGGYLAVGPPNYGEAGFAVC
jgi:hypothetical protein